MILNLSLGLEGEVVLVHLVEASVGLSGVDLLDRLLRGTAVRACLADVRRGEVEAGRARHTITWPSHNILTLTTVVLVAALRLESLLVEVIATLADSTLPEDVSADVFLRLRSNSASLLEGITAHEEWFITSWEDLRLNLVFRSERELVSRDSHGSTWLNVDLEVISTELVCATEFAGETLHDELLADGELWIGAQFQKNILGKESIPDAF